eukprot:4361034-Amphidinium_carterae.1
MHKRSNVAEFSIHGRVRASSTSRRGGASVACSAATAMLVCHKALRATTKAPSESLLALGLSSNAKLVSKRLMRLKEFFLATLGRAPA